MAKRIRWWSSNGMQGDERSEEIEVADDATEEEIREAVREAVHNYFEIALIRRRWKADGSRRILRSWPKPKLRKSRAPKSDP